MLDILNRKFKERSKVYPLLFSLALLASLVLTSCEQKQPEEVSVQKDSVQVKAEETAVVIPDLKGKWTGTFDKRATTFRITEQDGMTFKGSITINYREVINQQVSGTVNQETMEVNMKDLLHSRYAGTYKGKFSDDMKTFSGTFTQNVDKTKYSYSLKKQ